MLEKDFDVVVIGGGPAGLAAALEAKKGGARVAVLERNFELGGILQQCIHDGFGLMRFGKSMSGATYAQHFIDETEKTDIAVYTDTMVLEVTPQREIYACNTRDGMLHLRAGAVILAMGCRERTAGQILLYGFRPKGVLTAGAAQRYINIDGYLPGKKAVILGSGDIGLIMARRMTLEGIEVKGVYEVMPTPGGLARNIAQCLEDYGIPLHLAHTVVKVHGVNSLEGVTVAALGPDGRPVPGTEEYVECDLLVLSVGLIPENELSVQAGVPLDAKTRGPVVDETGMTGISGIFACGNVAVVYDLVDYVSQSGETAARGALAWLAAGKPQQLPAYRAVKAAGGVNFVVPQRVRCRTNGEPVQFYLRVKKPVQRCTLQCTAGGEHALRKPLPFADPPSMLACSAALPDGEGEIVLDMEEV